MFNEILQIIPYPSLAADRQLKSQLVSVKKVNKVLHLLGPIKKDNKYFLNVMK